SPAVFSPGQLDTPNWIFLDPTVIARPTQDDGQSRAKRAEGGSRISPRPVVDEALDYGACNLPDRISAKRGENRSQRVLVVLRRGQFHGHNLYGLPSLTQLRERHLGLGSSLHAHDPLQRLPRRMFSRQLLLGSQAHAALLPGQGAVGFWVVN